MAKFRIQRFLKRDIIARVNYTNGNVAVSQRKLFEFYPSGKAGWEVTMNKRTIEFTEERLEDKQYIKQAKLKKIFSPFSVLKKIILSIAVSVFYFAPHNIDNKVVLILLSSIIGLAIQFYFYYFEVPDEKYLKIDNRTLKQKVLDSDIFWISVFLVILLLVVLLSAAIAVTPFVLWEELTDYLYP